MRGHSSSRSRRHSRECTSGSGSSCGLRSRRPSGNDIAEIAKDGVAVRREDRLGMKLNPLDGERGVPDAHDLSMRAAPSGRRDDELSRQTLRVDRQRVISTPANGARDPSKDAGAVVLDVRHFSVRDLRRRANAGAKDMGDRLVAQADAEDGNGGAEVPNDLEADPRLGGPPRARRKDEAFGALRRQSLDGRLVVLDDTRKVTELAEVLNEVVRKRVVVID